MRVKNGGVQFGIMQAIGFENLSEKDKKIYKKLEALPKGRWVYLDKDFNEITQEEYLGLDKTKFSTEDEQKPLNFIDFVTQLLDDQKGNI